MTLICARKILIFLKDLRHVFLNDTSYINPPDNTINHPIFLILSYFIMLCETTFIHYVYMYYIMSHCHSNSLKACTLCVEMKSSE